MEKLNNKKWDEFSLEDIFTVSPGKRLETRNKISGNRPFIGATDNGNGVTGFVANDNVSKDSNVLGVNYNGAPCIAFYHPYECIFTDDVKRLHLKNYIDNENTLLFFTEVFAKQRMKYNYGYKFKEKRMLRQKLMLPVTNSGEPDYDFMADYTKRMRKKLITRYREYAEKCIDELGEEIEIPALGKKEWREFAMNDIFVIGHGFYNKKPPMYQNGDIPFIGATDSHNGVTGFTYISDIERCSKTGSPPNEPLDRKIFHGASIGVTNNGSVGYAYYQPSRFTCTHDVNPLYFRDGVMPEPLAHFLCVCIHKQAVCFEYARKWRPKRMVHSKIMLPINDSGNPDYAYMEQYAKNMMLRKYRQYLKFLDSHA